MPRIDFGALGGKPLQISGEFRALSRTQIRLVLARGKRASYSNCLSAYALEPKL